MYEPCRRASNRSCGKVRRLVKLRESCMLRCKETSVISMQTTMGTISSTFEAGVSMKSQVQATGGAEKMYINLWIAAGRCGVRRVRGLAPESQWTRARIEPCQANRASHAPDQGKIGKRTYCRICCNWLGEWRFGWEELRLRDSPRESVPDCQAGGGDVIAESSDEYRSHNTVANLKRGVPRDRVMQFLLRNDFYALPPSQDSPGYFLEIYLLLKYFLCRSLFASLDFSLSKNIIPYQQKAPGQPCISRGQQQPNR
jgi:hypothetical protein